MDPQTQPAADPNTKDLTITFNTSTFAFGFAPDPLVVRKAHQKIKFKLDNASKNAGAKIVSITFSPSENETEGGIPDWSDPNGKNSVTLDDKDKQTATTGDLSFKYTVTVRYNSVDHPGDPKILNKPVVG